MEIYLCRIECPQKQEMRSSRVSTIDGMEHKPENELERVVTLSRNQSTTY